MQATIKSLKEDHALGIQFCHAPSLTAAIRADAEILASICSEHNITSSEGALVKYILGNVNADVTCYDDIFCVTFYKDDETTPFAIVEVK